MANYSTGTVTITEGSFIVKGDGTRWLTKATPGRYITFAGINKPYQIGAIIDDVTIQLVKPLVIVGIAGTNLSLLDQSYAIVDSFTPNLSIPIIGKDDIDKQPRFVRAFNIIDQAKALIVGWEIKNSIESGNGASLDLHAISNFTFFF